MTHIRLSSKTIFAVFLVLKDFSNFKYNLFAELFRDSDVKKEFQNDLINQPNEVADFAPYTSLYTGHQDSCHHCVSG